MKKAIFIFVLMCLYTTCNAGKIVVINDSISVLRNQDTLKVSMDYSDAIYNPKKVKKDETGKKQNPGHL